MRAALAGVAVIAASVCAVLAAAAPAPRHPDAEATGLVARVAIPGLGELLGPTVAAPPDGAGGGAVTLPTDGSAVRIGASTVVARAFPGTSSRAESSVSALGVSLLGGEITVESVAVRSSAAAGSSGAAADTDTSRVAGLVVLGQPVDATDPADVPLGDWGTLAVVEWTTEVDDRSEPHSGKASVVALRVELTADHGGLPAGTVIEVGVASASATAAAGRPAADTTDRGSPPSPVPVPGDLVPGTPASPVAAADLTAREPGSSIAGVPPELVRPASEVTARLSSGGYVFPLFGPASFGDTFGAYRGDIPGNWHHGEDIVAPVGTPLLAVADGTIFAAGWNALGGWKLWLRDAAGNEFYYAHLSAYSPLAVNGQRVSAGDVIGFVGATGDADGGVPHLHFEIHPAALLDLGYDGAVAPYPFLVSWRRAEDASFTDGRRYVADSDLRPGVGLPRVGAYVLEIDDIGGTSGLVPGALERALGAHRGAARPSG